MKIENNGIPPLTAKPTEAANLVDKKEDLKDVDSVRSGQDTMEMSENARLLAKARAALGNVEDTDSERLALIKRQIESGDYTVQVSDLARKLVAKFYPKE
jgi:flagellar biosynthesis anti-sigma factor FlgM